MAIRKGSHLIKTVLRNPNCLRYLGSELGQRLNQSYWSVLKEVDGIEVMNRDWDTLVLLDACRYDIYSECVEDEQVECVRSVASTSQEFIRYHFIGQEHHDTVYVTANAYVNMLTPDVFHATIETLGEEWDPDIRTVRPSSLREKAVEIHNEFPDKRVIVHFMQPHLPFITEFGQLVEDKLNKWGRMHRPGPETTAGEVREAYKESLEIALKEVCELNESVTGKVVVSSDHGELLGERQRPIPVKQWGHQPNLPMPKLLNVPWHELEYSERREVSSDRPVLFETTDEVDQKLAAFGYK